MTDTCFPVPKRSRSVIRIPYSRLRAGDTVTDAYLLHMKETDYGFVCAEGISPIEMPFTEEAVKLYALPDELFSLNYVPRYDWYAFYAVFEDTSFYTMKVQTFHSAVPVSIKPLQVNRKYFFVVCDSETGLYFLSNGMVTDYSQHMGGTCGVFYMGRMFVAQEQRIIYTATNLEENWEIERNTDEQKSGALYVDRTFGDFVDAIVYRDKAYFFAKYSVLRITADGHILNTRTYTFPQSIGETLAGTCRILDDKIYFLTTRGLCRFDGNTFERVKTPCARQIDYSAAVEVGIMDGKYCAHVALRDGNRRIYVYDPLFGRESFLSLEADSFSACNKGYILRDNSIYELTGRGLPPNGEPCRLCMRLSLGERNNPCTEWVCIEGEGEFTVEASTEEDACAFTKGSAGRKLYLSRVLRGGELALTVSTFTEDFRITGISVGVGEDQRYDD